MSKKSFFEKLTGGISLGNEDEFTINEDTYEYESDDHNSFEDEETPQNSFEDEVGELSIDMYRVNKAIIIKTMVPGISKNEIEISLTRDTVTIQGSRKHEPEARIEEHYFEELYWGAFERTINLPEEVDIELAEAHESHGLLTLVLPLVDKDRQARLKIK